MSLQAIALLDCLLLDYQFVGKLDCGLWIVDCWIIILTIVQNPKMIKTHRPEIGLRIVGYENLRGSVMDIRQSNFG